MGEQWKEALKKQIKHKRASEGLTEIPDDLFAKKPRYELTGEERNRLCERRKKNKEAAEKSRKKKKEEFMKLMTENDQLQQDKCQLVAMTDKLRNDLSKVSQENSKLRHNIDHLKRWIGKHAKDLGLGKHLQKRQADEVRLAKALEPKGRESVLRDDPSLHSAAVVPADESQLDQQLSGSSSPSLPSATSFSEALNLSSVSPARLSSTPPVSSFAPVISQANSGCSDSQLPLTQELFQPVGIRTVVSLPQQLPVPLAMQQYQPVTDHQSESQGQEGTVYVGGQQFVYLPKDSYMIVQGEDGQQVMMVTPEVQQMTVVPQYVQTISGEVSGMVGAQVQVPQVPEMNANIPTVPESTAEVPEVSQPPEEENVQVAAVQDANEGVQEELAVAGVQDTPTTQYASVESSELQMATVEVPQVEGQPVSVETPREQTSPPDNSTTTETLHGNVTEHCVAAKEVTETTHTPPALDSATLASSLDLLLKLGYKIQLPGGVQLLSDAKGTPTLTVDHEH